MPPPYAPHLCIYALLASKGVTAPSHVPHPPLGLKSRNLEDAVMTSVHDRTHSFIHVTCLTAVLARDP